jgi:hypothetical protein
MADSALVKKLGIKPGQGLLIMNAPQGYIERLSPLPEGASLATGPGGSFGFVQLFVANRAELNALAPAALEAAQPGALLWFAYPKRSSKLPTDLTRDEGWSSVTDAGFDGVAQISIDATWSAVRFRPGAPPEELLAAQYAGPRAALQPIYERLTAAATELGPDVTLNTRKSYVALHRARQFAVIQPSTNTRIDLGLKLPGLPPTERLQPSATVGGGAITHSVALASANEVDDQVLAWLRAAYEREG